MRWDWDADPAGGDKPRPYEKSESVFVGAAICRPAAFGRSAARVDEDIDPYRAF